jgi:hypothetical protein
MTWTFRLPLPPHGVNMATEPNSRGGRYKTAESRAWERGVALIVGDWTPPERTPLRVVVTLEMPKRLLRRADADKWAAVVADAVIGARRDQWIDEQVAIKRLGDGWAEITVEPMEVN